jgi:hypothetical protein
MLIGLASVKGSPGVTSTALALAAAWPRQVVLLEADLAGGDLAYRCRAAHGGPVYSTKGLLRLGAAVRGGMPGPGAVTNEAQLLACGVNLVQGVTTVAQARGLSGLWPTIAQACTAAEVDVIADLGRLDRSSAVMPLAQATDYLLPVASTTLESVMHLTEGLNDVVGGLAQRGTVNVSPILVGPDAHSARDCADLDDLLTRAGLPILRTQPVPYDPKTLQRLEQGERATGRLGRTFLLRAARAIAGSMVQSVGSTEVSA